MKTKKVSIVIVAILLILIGYYWAFDRVSKRKILGWEFSSAMTIQEIEESQLKSLRSTGHADLPPFGYENAKWEKLKSLYRPGDIIYLVSSSTNMENGEDSITGGYVLTRGDIIIFEIVTYVS